MELGRDIYRFIYIFESYTHTKTTLLWISKTSFFFIVLNEK